MFELPSLLLRRLCAVAVVGIGALLSGCIAQSGQEHYQAETGASTAAPSASVSAAVATDASATAPTNTAVNTAPSGHLSDEGGALVTPQDLPAVPAPPLAAETTTATAPAMAYVALGDSLTAGMQSAGLTAAGQYAAYPTVVARLTDVRFGVPATRRGCPVPMGGGLQAESCERVVAGIRSSNFAIPGAKVSDLYLARGGVSSDELSRRMYGLILGSQQTQVEAAIKSRPAYITLWIGSNDALSAVTEGDPSLVTPPEEFAQHYRHVLEGLRPTGAKVLLLTVPDVTRVPLMSSGAVLFEKGVADENCQGSDNLLPLTAFLVGQRLSCTLPSVLTPEEKVTIQATVHAYNEAIYRLGAEFGYDVLSVQPLLDKLDMHPATDETSPTPFGQDMSADGIHPSAAGQLKLGYAITDYVNRYWEIGLPQAAQQEMAAAGIKLAD